MIYIIKKEIYDNYYAEFHTLWDSIHQGRAYNFSHLTYNQQESIVEFFIETDRYQTNEVRMLVYELKTNRLNNFDNQSNKNIKICDDAYNKLTEVIIDQYYKK